MSFGSGIDSFKVKTFETEEEVNEKKRLRQEQWEKVRKPDDPEECPEEETRSLFEQLQANKETKEREYEEQFKMRNSVPGLEEEETKFLNFVSNRQVQLEREREKEESVVLEQMKEAAVKRVTEKILPVPEVKKSVPSTSSAKKSQQSLLLGAIKRKSTDASPDDSTKRKRSESEKSENNSSPAEDKLLKLIDTSLPVAQVAGILPGIGSYNEDTSDSNSSSAESDIEDYIKTKKTVIRVHVQQT